MKNNKSHPATPLISSHLSACACKHGAHLCLHFRVSSLSLKSSWPEIPAWIITFCLMPTPEESSSSPSPPYLKLTLSSLHILFVLIFCLIFLYSFVFLIKFGPVFLISYIFRISYYLAVSFPTFMLHFMGKMYIIKILNEKKFY